MTAHTLTWRLSDSTHRSYLFKSASNCTLHKSATSEIWYFKSFPSLDTIQWENIGAKWKQSKAGSLTNSSRWVKTKMVQRKSRVLKRYWLSKRSFGCCLNESTNRTSTTRRGSNAWRVRKLPTAPQSSFSMQIQGCIFSTLRKHQTLTGLVSHWSWSKMPLPSEWHSSSSRDTSTAKMVKQWCSTTTCCFTTRSTTATSTCQKSAYKTKSK